MAPYRAIPGRPKSVRRFPYRKLWLGVGITAGLFVLINLLLFAVYFGRTYPRDQVAGQPFGNVSFAASSEKLQKLPLLPDKLQVDFGVGAKPIAPAALGVTIDNDNLQQAVKKRGWLPIANVLSRRDTPLTIAVDEAVLQKQIIAWSTAIATTPVDARIDQKDDTFVFVDQKNGKNLHAETTRLAVLTALRTGKQSVKLDARSIPPPITNAKLEPQFDSLQSAQKLAIKYNYSGKQATAQVADIVSWYRRDGTTYTPSDSAIKGYLSSLGADWQLRLNNIDAAVAATKLALDTHKPLDFQLQATAIPPPKTFTYCTAVRGVDPAYLPELNRKLETSYADERGWGLSGAVRFVRAASNCSFTVWLTAAEQMPTFGAICDADWSCQIGANVVLNFNRWQNASDAWNASGGSLFDYRHMVINHETGHWLGFGHSSCPGSGLPAPVMQQQSINLAGCSFNPWPTASEQATLKSILGI